MSQCVPVPTPAVTATAQYPHVSGDPSQMSEIARPIPAPAVAPVPDMSVYSEPAVVATVDVPRGVVAVQARGPTGSFFVGLALGSLLTHRACTGKWLWQ